MTKRGRHFSSEFKFRVVLEAAKGQKTVSELASEYSVHPNQISQWKRQLLDGSANLLASNGTKTLRVQEETQSELYERIGRLKMELEWLKKKLPSSPEEKRRLIKPAHPDLSRRRKFELLGLNRSTCYYEVAGESAENLRLIDEQYPRTPFYGWPRMTAHLRRQGHEVNHKRVQRLMQLMSLQAIYPKPKTSVAGKGHQVYPYLLRDLEIRQPNFVWSADITYRPLHQGFMYLVANIDWFSRYVLAWQLSNTLDGYFCFVALQQALPQNRPAVFNTDRAPVRAFIFSGGNPPFPVEVGTAQRLTQRSKDSWEQSGT